MWPHLARRAFAVHIFLLEVVVGGVGLLLLGVGLVMVGWGCWLRCSIVGAGLESENCSLKIMEGGIL